MNARTEKRTNAAGQVFQLYFYEWDTHKSVQIVNFETGQICHEVYSFDGNDPQVPAYYGVQ